MSKDMTRDGGVIILENNDREGGEHVCLYRGLVYISDVRFGPGTAIEDEYCSSTPTRSLLVAAPGNSVKAAENSDAMKKRFLFVYPADPRWAITTVNTRKSLDRSFSSLRLRFSAIMAGVAVYPGK
jgi:hypothetical protein